MFNRIEAQNLFSWESLDFPIKKGFTQIDGWNFDDSCQEGSGKSACLNILVWVLYGKIPKDAKIDEVVREGQKNGVGVIHFEDGHTVVRSRKPNDLFIQTPEGEDLRGKDARETQQMVESLVGMGFDSFCQCIYYPQNYENKFITAPEEGKAKILSDVQDLTVFDKARKAAQERLREAKQALLGKERDLDKAHGLLEEIQNSKETIQNLLESFEEEKKQQLLDLETKIFFLTEEICEIEAELRTCEKTEIKEALEVLFNTDEKLQESLRAAKTKLETTASKQATKDALNRTLRNLEKSRASTQESLSELAEESGACPMCGGPLGDEHQAKIQAKRDKLQGSLYSLEEEIKETQAKGKTIKVPSTEAVDAEIQKLKMQIRTNKEEISEIQALESQFDKKMVQVERKKESLETLKDRTAKLMEKLPQKEQEQLELLNAREEKGTQVVKDFTKEVKVLAKEVVKWEVLKDGYKEVKQYVFRDLLNDLSKKSTAFLNELFEMPVKIRFYNDGESGEVSKILTEVTIDGQPRPLGLYSGGQARRIQLAVDLALSQIIANRSQKPIDFRALDEPFRDLSEKSVRSMCRLLQKLPGTTIIIEHNPHVKSLVENQFWVELRDGVSAEGEPE